MEKLIAISIVVVVLSIGSIVTTLVDNLIGIDITQQVGYLLRIVHNVIYMAWGGAISLTIAKFVVEGKL